MHKPGHAFRPFEPPYPEGHTINGEKMPPDGTAQPEPDDRNPPHMKSRPIGGSSPAGQDFGPYIEYRGEGLYPSFQLDFTNTIPYSTGGVHPHTGLLLFALALNLRPDVIIETGTAYGYSTFYLAKACEVWGQGKVYTFGANEAMVCDEIKNHPHVEFIPGRSDGALFDDLLRRVGSVDMVFLDSWKRIACFEWIRVDPYLVEGGIVAIHDTQLLNTGRTLYEMFEGHLLGYDRLLFTGIPHVDNPHRFFGNADDRGLYVLHKRMPNSFLNVADAETKRYGNFQVWPQMNYVPAQIDLSPSDQVHISKPQRWALAVSMYDEIDSMMHNVKEMGRDFVQIEVVQSQMEPYPALMEALEAHPCGHYHLFPNLDTRTAEDKAANTERFDIVTKSMTRNFAHAFQQLQESLDKGPRFDYVVAITGDTRFDHMAGIEHIIEQMGEAEIACSRAMGQNFHQAGWTREQMADPEHPKEGRLQDETVKDFMPQFFILKASLVKSLSQLSMTNPWCFEQCLGDAIGDTSQFVFSSTAYGFKEGITYHVPSEGGWKHGA